MTHNDTQRREPVPWEIWPREDLAEYHLKSMGWEPGRAGDAINAAKMAHPVNVMQYLRQRILDVDEETGDKILADIAALGDDRDTWHHTRKVYIDRFMTKAEYALEEACYTVEATTNTRHSALYTALMGLEVMNEARGRDPWGILIDKLETMYKDASRGRKARYRNDIRILVKWRAAHSTGHEAWDQMIQEPHKIHTIGPEDLAPAAIPDNIKVVKCPKGIWYKASRNVVK